MEQANDFKKRGQLEEALRVYQELCHEYPTNYLAWQDWSRCYFDQGLISKSREVLLQGLQCIPDSEALLSRLVKAEERLRNVQGVIAGADRFMSLPGVYNERDRIEIALVVAKMGCQYKAAELFERLLRTKQLQPQQPIYLDYIRFVFKAEDYQKGLQLLKAVLNKQVRQETFWFFSFSVFEQHHTFACRRGDIRSRANNSELEGYLERAEKCLAKEHYWKMNYVAAQAHLRSFTHIRLWTRAKKRRLRSYCEVYPAVIRVCFDSLRRCVEFCEDDHKWKVWILAGRVQALAGNRRSAIRVGVRRSYQAVFDAEHGVRAVAERPRGVSGAVAHSGLHWAAGRSEPRDPVEHAALPRRVEAGFGASEPALPREPRAGRVPFMHRLAAPRSHRGSFVVLLHPNRSPVFSFFLSLSLTQIVRPLRGAPAVLRGAEVRGALRRGLVRGRARLPQPHLPAFQPAQRAALPHVRRPLHSAIR